LHRGFSEGKRKRKKKKACYLAETTGVFIIMGICFGGKTRDLEKKTLKTPEPNDTKSRIPIRAKMLGGEEIKMARGEH